MSTKSHQNLRPGSPAADALPVVRRMIRALRQAGFALHSVDDGGERIRTESETDMLDAIFSVDEAWAYFQYPDHPKRLVVWLIACNGFDVLSDWSAGDSPAHKAFEQAVESAYRN